MVIDTPKKKRRKPTPLTSRALTEMRSMGFDGDVVEKRLPKCFITKDYIGCIDIIAFREGVGVLGIQVTSGDNHAARRKKAAAEPRLRGWLASGARFEVWSYAKRGERSKRKVYQLRREEIRTEDLVDAGAERGNG